MIDQIKIILPHMVDTRDFKKYKAFMVLGGNAMLIERPLVPFFLLNNVEDIYNIEKIICQRSIDAHMVHANRIIADTDDDAQVRRTLLVFPNGMNCRDALPDLTKKKKQKRGTHETVKKCLRYLTVNYVSGKSNTNTEQEFYPLYWLLRIVDTNRRILKAEEVEEEEEDEDIDSAMKGMKLA